MRSQQDSFSDQGRDESIVLHIGKVSRKDRRRPGQPWALVPFLYIEIEQQNRTTEIAEIYRSVSGFFSVATQQYNITRPLDMLETCAIANFEGLCRAFIFYFSKKNYVNFFYINLWLFTKKSNLNLRNLQIAIARIKGVRNVWWGLEGSRGFQN